MSRLHLGGISAIYLAYPEQEKNESCHDEPEQNDDANSPRNCRQLNAAPAYFDGGVVNLRHVGVTCYHLSLVTCNF